ncbi:MAG: DedA family protein [Gemmatimonadales bacterium]
MSLPATAVYGVIAVLAGVENVFPPVPADTAVALGAFLARYGTVSALSVFLVTWSVNVLGASAVYVAARTLGRRFFLGRVGRRLIRRRSLARIEKLYEDYGVWGIFLSRFVPGVRAVVPPFAGVAGLGSFRALAPVVVASAVWYGTLMLLVVTLAGPLAGLALLLKRVNTVVLILALILAGAIGGVIYLRKKRRVWEERR